jgi:hypothetical protein
MHQQCHLATNIIQGGNKVNKQVNTSKWGKWIARIWRCHGCYEEGTHIFKEGCEVLEHTIDLIFRSPKW